VPFPKNTFVSTSKYPLNDLGNIQRVAFYEWQTRPSTAVVRCNNHAATLYIKKKPAASERLANTGAMKTTE